MNFAKQASKLLTNKYVLYFLVALSVANLIGYLVLNKLNALVFFVLTGILMMNFSKNMTIVLLVCLLVTNTLMRSRVIEGMENQQQPPAKQPADSTDDSNTDKIPDTDIRNAVSDKLKKSGKDDNAPIVPEYSDQSNGGDAPAPADQQATVDNFTGYKKGSKGMSPSRIDYAATLEQSYDNLEKMLGNGGLQNLTNDTKKLMQQQKELFKTMETMAPMLNEAEGWLKSLNMDGLTNMAKTSGAPPKF